MTIKGGYPDKRTWLAVARCSGSVPVGRERGKALDKVQWRERDHVLVLRTWRLSLEKIADWLGRSDDLAVALGMPADGPTISAAQLSRRHRRLGVWPYFFIFLALAWRLVCLGAISGRHLIMASTA